tara:strand:+ start:152 stop:283 length:132 start_codon:yes stop_codon:yes gene_type:complete
VRRERERSKQSEGSERAREKREGRREHISEICPEISEIRNQKV